MATATKTQKKAKPAKARKAVKDPTPHIGVDADGRTKVGKELGKVLADTYTLYLKTHNFHWNVRGPHFHALHNQFEEQYVELAAAVDEIAERIRALGVDAPGSYRQFGGMNSIDEAPDTPPEALTMAAQLAEDHEAVAKTCRATLGVAEGVEDEVTVDMMVERMTVHDKAAWMLRSIAA